MEGTGLSATAMLTPTDAGGRPDAATITMAREEIEEALASDEPLELVLTVDRGAGSPQDVRVGWQRSDLETVLAGTDAGGITFSFDRAELYRAIEHPDFEGHGIREMVLLTVAAASASAALAASTASGQVLDTAGGGGGTSVTAVQPGDPGTIPYLSQGVGVDQSQFQGDASTAGTQAEPGTIPYLSQGIGVDQSQFQGDASTAGTQAEPGTIPYLSQGIGVDQSQFQGDASTAGTQAEPGTIPYLSQGIGVDQSQFQGDASTAGTVATPAAHDEATLLARGIDPAIATAMASHGEAATASQLASVAGIHDETTPAARGVGQTIPGADEATLAARGIETPAVHDEGTLVTRGIESEPVVVDSGSSLELPSVDPGTAAAIGGLAGASLLIVGAAFVARRRTTPV